MTALFVAAALVANAGELETARAALRDGLWDVARFHAAKSGEGEARIVELESYARDGRWTDLLAAAGGNESGDPGVAYYRALALYETGDSAAAAAVLSSFQFEGTGCAAAAARLMARIALDGGDTEGALKIARESGFDRADVDSRMAAADILAASGDRRAAENIWRAVASDTNSSARACVAAASNLADPALLRAAAARVEDAALARSAGLRLGCLLLSSPDTFDEGTNLISTIAADAPDAEGARAAYTAMADALLEAGRWQAAAAAYLRILESWPDAASDAQVHEGRGWALRRLGRAEEAVEAFSRAEECASGDDGKARAALARGDVLSDAGRRDEAMSVYKAALAAYPGTEAAGRLRKVVAVREKESAARGLYDAYRFREAQEIFGELAAEDPPGAPRYEFCQALCLYGQRRDSEALDKVRAIAVSGQDPEIRADAVLWLAKYAYNSRRWGESRDLFTMFATNMAPRSAQAPSALLWAARASKAANEHQCAVDIVSRLVKDYPDAAETSAGYLVQGEALIELARFDEASLVLDRALLSESAPSEDRLRAQVLKADALFAMGADNPARYKAALDGYRRVKNGESLSPGFRIEVSFKIARTLEKMRRLDEAIDEYYTEVVLAYRDGRLAEARFDDSARAVFARAAFRLADEYESRGMDYQAVRVLELVVSSDAPAAAEAARRINRIHSKGHFL